jgi:hypothetical protein
MAVVENGVRPTSSLSRIDHVSAPLVVSAKWCGVMGTAAYNWKKQLKGC